MDIERPEKSPVSKALLGILVLAGGRQTAVGENSLGRNLPLDAS
jgi:hypothetical protein